MASPHAAPGGGVPERAADEPDDTRLVFDELKQLGRWENEGGALVEPAEDVHRTVAPS